MDVSLRKSVYAVMIILSLGLILGRILAVDSVNKQDLQKYRLNQIPKQLAEKEERLKQLGESPQAITDEIAKTEIKLKENAMLCVPFFSANDRSRWCTIRALVEPEMRVPGAPYAIDKVRLLRGWDTIDMVKHDGHYYSSKPPLLPTMMAGIYWILLNVFGLSFAENLYPVCITILICVNLPFMLLFLWSSAKLAELFGKSDLSKLFAVAVACFATFLSTFCVTLNNHLPAAACAAAALYLAMKMILSGNFCHKYSFLIGILSMFFVVNELPSLSLFAAIFLLLVIYLPWKSDFQNSVRHILLWTFGVLVVLTPILGTNYIAHNSFRPPYMHRKDGDNWYEYVYETSSGKTVESYWQNPKGLDVGEPSRAKYAFHVLFGHHGIFSLTPVWLFAIAGAYFMFRSDDQKLRLFGFMVLSLTALVVAFYIMRPLGDRNYGGNTCGLRWTFWLIPLWIAAMPTALEKIENRPLLWKAALLCLLFSAVSVSFPTWNPWTHPWLFLGQ